MAENQEPYLDDPEPGDENDPEYRLEMFETFKACKIPPEKITTDDAFRDEYAAWLKET